MQQASKTSSASSTENVIPKQKEPKVTEALTAEETTTGALQNTKPRVARKPIGGFSASGSISIKDFTKSGKGAEEEIEKIIADPSHYGSKNFTEEEFKECWKKLAEKIAQSNDQGKSMVYSALTTHEPEMRENNQVLVKVDNRSQLEEVMEKRTELHEFLRNQLQNGSVEIHLEVIKNKKEKKAYTQEEKFQVMVDQNPNILELKKRFDLDIF